MPIVPFEEIPGYIEAVAQESLIRDAAALEIRENIAGFQAMPLTLRRWLLLRMAGSPLLIGEIPGPSELVTFLWIVSPDYNPERKGRLRFEWKCKWRLGFCRFSIRSKAIAKDYAHKLCMAQEVIKACNDYLSEAFQDRPSSTRNGNGDPMHYSSAMYYVGLLGRWCGWTRNETLDCPLKLLFQIIKVLLEIEGAGGGQSNASDSRITDYLKALNHDKARRG